MGNEDKESEFDFGSLLEEKDSENPINQSEIEEIKETEELPEIWEICPYCQNEYLQEDIKNHKKYCKKNPKNIKKEEKIPNKLLVDLANNFSDLKDIKENLNEVLYFAKLGKEHVLSKQNVISYLKQLSNEKAKLCDFKRQFHDNTSYEIDSLIKQMKSEGYLGKTNYFYHLTKKGKEGI